MAVDPVVVDLLSAWATWSRQDPDDAPAPPTCQSAEHLYRGEAGEVFQDDREAAAPIVPDHVALPVDRAVAKLDLMHRGVLIAVYLRRMTAATIEQRFRADARLLLNAAHRADADQLQLAA